MIPCARHQLREGKTARSTMSWSIRKLPRPAIVHAAAIQDRDGGVPPMRTLFGLAHSCANSLPTAAQKEGGSNRD
jgi:hypothetical protein